MKKNRIKELYYKIKFKKMITTDLSIGTKLVVVGCTSGHGSPIGTKLTLKNWYYGSGCGTPATGVQVNECNSWFSLCDVRLDSYTKKDLEEELKNVEEKLTEAKTNVENVKLKIEFIKETGSSNFNENEYRAYNTLKTLEYSKLSTLEKAKHIASLFNK
jgi:hypothetical protein